MAAARKLVVTGATGKQGGALIKALLAKPSQPFEIYALTRDKTSRSAQALASKPNVHVIQGDFSNPDAIFKQIEKPWGLFSVTMPMNAKKEEAEGKAMTKAAFEADVKHIVFTSADRGGNAKSDVTPTYVPHFRSKYNIEQDIKERSSKQRGVTWTFLRPVAFFENLSNNFFGRAFVAMWRLNGLDRPLQQISTTDIGLVAADAFLNADSDEYKNKSITLAGDEVSPNEAKRIFKEVTGQELPYSYPIVGRLIRWLAKEQLGLMLDWFVTDDFGADVKVLRQRYPFMKTFRQWVAEESAWKKA